MAKGGIKKGTVIHPIKFITRIKHIWQSGLQKLKNGGRVSSGMPLQHTHIRTLYSSIKAPAAVSTISRDAIMQGKCH